MAMAPTISPLAIFGNRRRKVGSASGEHRATLFDEGANAFADVVGVEEKEEVPPLVRKALRERRFVGRAPPLPWPSAEFAMNIKIVNTMSTRTARQHCLCRESRKSL
jgi:hypothetical protein